MQGTRQVAERIVIAQEHFTQVVMERGFTRAQAQRAVRALLRLGAAKLDPVGGRITVVHGAFLEHEALRRATQGPFEVTGVKGVKSRPFRKVFKTQAAYEAWLEKNEGNVEVHASRELED